MKGVNKVILIGTLGKDPESKSFGNGGTICNFNIATSEKWTDKATGEPREHTEWHRITANSKLAEICQQYLRKGSKVYIEGSIRTRQYTDKDGIERYSTEIRADQMQMLDSKGSDNQSASATYAKQPQAGYATVPPQQRGPSVGSNGEVFSDDLPF